LDGPDTHGIEERVLDIEDNINKQRVSECAKGISVYSCAFVSHTLVDYENESEYSHGYTENHNQCEDVKIITIYFSDTTDRILRKN